MMDNGRPLLLFSVRQSRADADGWHGQSSAREGRTLPVVACPQVLPRAGSARTSLCLPMPPKLSQETLQPKRAPAQQRMNRQIPQMRQS